MTEALLGMLAGGCVLCFLRARRRDPALLRSIQELGLARVPQEGLHVPIMDRLASRLPSNRVRVRELLDASAVSMHVERVILLRWAGLALGVVAGSMSGAFALVATPLLGAAGFLSPIFFLKRRISARREQMAGDLPDAVEMLAVATDAGLNLQLALRRLADRYHGVLGDELRRTVDEIELGVPMRKGLSNLASRNDVSHLRELVTTINNAERFGTQIAGTLESFARDLRIRRRRAAEERARRAPVKMLFPLVFLILPAFILLTVVPLLLGTLQTLGL